MSVILCAMLAAGLAGGEAKVGRFEVRNEVKIKVPEGTKKVRAWIVLPQADPAQSVEGLKIESPVPTRRVHDSEGNELLYVEAADPKAGEMPVVVSFTVKRSEVLSGPATGKAYAPEDLKGKEKYLQPNANVVIDDRIRKLSGEITGGEKNPDAAARKLYDWVLKNVDYWVKDPKNKKASPVGSTAYCLENKTGNCTDFHSLWMSLARAAGIPCRIVYGSLFKTELDGQPTDASYHCWVEFLRSGGSWAPLDVSVADIYQGDFATNPDNEVLVRRTTSDGYKGPEPAKVDYYFGNLDERRVVWSSGRDLTLEPKQDGGPVNALPKAYIEVDGKVHPEKTGWERKMTYQSKS